MKYSAIINTSICYSRMVEHQRSESCGEIFSRRNLTLSRLTDHNFSNRCRLLCPIQLSWTKSSLRTPSSQLCPKYGKLSRVWHLEKWCMKFKYSFRRVYWLRTLKGRIQNLSVRCSRCLLCYNKLAWGAFLLGQLVIPATRRPVPNTNTPSVTSPSTSPSSQTSGNTAPGSTPPFPKC